MPRTLFPDPLLRRGFTLVEIMIVVGIIGILVAIVAPTWIKQRTFSRQKSCQENLTKIDGAKTQWALDNNQAETASPGWGELVQTDGNGYLKRQPVCPGGGTYILNAVNQEATCSITTPLNHNL